MKQATRELNGAKRALAHYLKSVGEAQGDADVWLVENADMLRAALTAALRWVRRGARFPFACAKAFAETLTALLSSGGDVGAAELSSLLARAFAGTPLTLRQLEALPVMLFSALSLTAVAARGTDRAAHAVRAFYLLRRADLTAWEALLCPGERLLEADPAGVYPRMDRATKLWYRRAFAKAAKKAGVTEEAYLAPLLAAAKQTGGHIGETLRVPTHKVLGTLLLLLQAGAARAGSLLLGFYAVRVTGVFGGWTYYAAGALASALLFFPCYTLLQPLIYKLGAWLFPPRVLPSLEPDRADFSPPPSLIVVSAILPAASKMDAWEQALSDLYFGAGVPDTGVLLLLDKKSADAPFLPSDEADLAALRRLVRRLNAAGGRFAFAVRPRVKNESETDYCGYERKRGALTALSVLLTTGDASAFETVGGETALLQNRRYLLALDQDTAAPPGALASLLAAAMHPLNRGYGCFAPRCEPALPAGTTLFRRLFAGGGLTAYAPAISEFYTDAFGEGIFCGKGLIDVARYRETCADAFEPGRVLSHDVPEGALLRTAFVSRVRLGEGFPSSPASYLSRAHRWMRGDAQNLRLIVRQLKKGRLTALHRFWLTDNLRRALTPPCALLVILLSAASPTQTALPLLLIGVFSTVGGRLVSAVSLLRREGLSVPFSLPLSSPAREGLCALAELALLPASAYNALDAVARGVWRQLVRRRTLEWTTAAAAEHGGKKPARLVLPALFAGAVLLSGAAAQRVVGLFFLLAIPFALSNGITLPERRGKLRFRDREQLADWAAATWRYYGTYVGAEDHFLPPDNAQELPRRMTAHRTSPTNIGLYLTSVLAAADLGLIGERELETRLGATFDALESLPLWRGLLYNWYDTRTLRPLTPAFVSTVDCGNFLVCLTALTEGLRERRLTYLAARAARLMKDADLSALYDPVRRLFYVGYDASAGQYTDAAYECCLSETLLTSVYAVARRQIPPSHFAALTRPVRKKGLRLLPLSYSGTAFEVLMPSLFLPELPGSYRAEAAAATVWAQKRAVRRTPYPWGRSESGRYVLGGALEYGYRANGLRLLALQPDANQERVFAPYAAFLAFGADPAGAMRDLRRFLQLGAYGACGFYEALDFEDRGLGEDYMPVKSYMAHHVGMSLLAAANLLRGDAFVRRFTADREIHAVLGLLGEKLPSPNVPRRSRKTPRKKTGQARQAGPVAPGRAAFFRAGEGALLCLPDGTDRLLFGGVSLLRDGLRLSLYDEKNEALPLASSLTATARRFFAETEGRGVSAALGVFGDPPVFALPVKTRGAQGALRLRVTGVPYFEPLFAQDPHAAFRELSVSVTKHEAHAAAVCRAGAGKPALAVGFWDASPFTLWTDRETLPPESAPLPSAVLRRGNLPVLALETLLPVRRGRAAETVLLFVPGVTADEALTRLAAIRRTRLPPLAALRPNVLPPEAGAAVALLFDGSRPAAVSENFAPLSALWEQGISGDVPLLRVDADRLPETRVAAAARLHRALLLGGVATDLVLFTEKRPAYGSAPDETLTRILPKGSLSLLGRSPGVHVVARSLSSPAFLSAVAAAPGTSLPPGRRLIPAPFPPCLPVQPDGPAENVFVPGGYYIGLPTPRPWGNVLANPAFGTLLTNRSLGFTWALNSRLNPLTPGTTDITKAPGGERLELTVGQTRWDLIAGAAVYFYPDRAVYLGRAGDVRARVTVRVPAKGMRKTVEVVLSAPGTLSCRVIPALADGPGAFLARCHAAGETLCFENPSNVDFPGVMTLSCPGGEAVSDGVGGEISVSAAAGEAVTFTMAFSRRGARDRK